MIQPAAEGSAALRGQAHRPARPVRGQPDRNTGGVGPRPRRVAGRRRICDRGKCRSGRGPDVRASLQVTVPLRWIEVLATSALVGTPACHGHRRLAPSHQPGGRAGTHQDPEVSTHNGQWGTEWRQTTTQTSPSRQPKARPPPSRPPTGDKQPPRRHLLANPSPDPRHHGPRLATNNHPDVTFSPTRAPSVMPRRTTNRPSPLPGTPSPDPAITAPDWRQTTTPTSPSRHPEPTARRHGPYLATNNHPDVTFSPHPEPDRPRRVATGADGAYPPWSPRQLLLPVAYMLAPASYASSPRPQT